MDYNLWFDSYQKSKSLFAESNWPLWHPRDNFTDRAC